MKVSIILTLLFAFLSCVENSPESNEEDGISLNEYQLEMFDYVNDHRAAKGKNKLEWHEATITEATKHSENMASYRTPVGHNGSGTRYANIRNSDPDRIVAFGENAAKNSNAVRAFNAWLRSNGHRRNIEGNYTHTGIGAVKRQNGSWYFTQIFLRK